MICDGLKSVYIMICG